MKAKEWHHCLDACCTAANVSVIIPYDDMYMGGSRGPGPGPTIKIWPKELLPLHFSHLILFITTTKIAINYFLSYSN